jgi:hypothetical protein
LSLQQLFYCSDRINYVSEIQRTMWESRGIRRELGRCDRQRVDPLFLPQSLFFFLPRAAPGTHPKLVGNTFASLFALGGLAIPLLLGLMPREAVAAQELYETIWA